MGQQEYDAFRKQSDMGVQQIMAQEITLIPEYGKLISKKINSGNADDIADVEAAFEKANLA